jgi:hypothetical protein
MSLLVRAVEPCLVWLRAARAVESAEVGTRFGTQFRCALRTHRARAGAVSALQSATTANPSSRGPGGCGFKCCLLEVMCRGLRATLEASGAAGFQAASRSSRRRRPLELLRFARCDGALAIGDDAQISPRASVRPRSPDTTAFTGSSSAPVDRSHPCAPLRLAPMSNLVGVDA